MSKQDVRWEYQGLKFVANQSKMSINLVLHNLDFRDVSRLFARENVLEKDTKHSTKTESRYLVYGYLENGKPITVGFTRRVGQVRIYTARLLDRHEEREMVAKLRGNREAELERSRGKERRSKDKAKTVDRELKRDIKERKRWKMRDNVRREANKDRDRER